MENAGPSFIGRIMWDHIQGVTSANKLKYQICKCFHKTRAQRRDQLLRFDLTKCLICFIRLICRLLGFIIAQHFIYSVWSLGTSITKTNKNMRYKSVCSVGFPPPPADSWPNIDNPPKFLSKLGLNYQLWSELGGWPGCGLSHRANQNTCQQVEIIHKNIYLAKKER